ncbi:MAG: hypothetical protein ACI4GX_05570 [Ruminococcus sp.]
MEIKILSNDSHAVHNREVYHWYASHGICTNCHSDEIYRERSSSLCLTCLMDQREVKYVYYREKMTTEQKYKLYLYNKRRNDLLRAFGVCLRCQKRDAAPGHVFCSNCLAKRRAYDEQKRREKGIVSISFNSPTICSRCKKTKPDNGSKLCPKCYADALKALEKAHRCQSNKNHIWRTENEIVFKRHNFSKNTAQSNMTTT